MDAPATGRIGLPSRPYRILDENRGAEHQLRPPGRDGDRSLWQRSLARTGGLLDRMTLRAIEAFFMSRDRPDLGPDLRQRIERAKQQYAAAELFEDPDRFFRPVPPPPEFCLERLSRLPCGVRLRLTFESTYRPYAEEIREQYQAFERNRVNRVHYWRHNRQRRPTIICIHTWGGGLLPLEELVFASRALYRLGMNVALFTMPFHGSRTPKQALFPGQLFPTRDLRRTNEAFGQAVADLRSLMKWLREDQKSGPIGMIGLSLGGYTTALLASLEGSLAFAVPIISPASFADLLWHHGSGRPGRKEAEAVGFTLQDFRSIWAIHCPLMHSVKLPRERLLIIWGAGDYVVPSLHQLALWEHWNRPQVESFHGGHLLQFGRSGYLRAVIQWLRRTVAGVGT